MLSKRLINSLRSELVKSCPVRTGALKQSISPVEITVGGFVITIGDANDTINGTPTNQYASVTNFSEYVGGTRKLNNPDGSVKTNIIPPRANPNYHWVNKAIKRWFILHQDEIVEEAIDNE